MPSYDYQCSACGHEFVRSESVREHERARVKCPECGSTRVERVFSAFYAKTGRKS